MSWPGQFILVWSGDWRKHRKKFRLTQRRLVKVLEGLGNQEERKQEHVNPLSDTLVLLRSLDLSAECPVYEGTTYDFSLLL